jgi:hypothetical protein
MNRSLFQKLVVVSALCTIFTPVIQCIEQEDQILNFGQQLYTLTAKMTVAEPEKPIKELLTSLKNDPVAQDLFTKAQEAGIPRHRIFVKAHEIAELTEGEDAPCTKALVTAYHYDWHYWVDKAKPHAKTAVIIATSATTLLILGFCARSYVKRGKSVPIPSIPPVPVTPALGTHSVAAPVIQPAVYQPVAAGSPTLQPTNYQPVPFSTPAPQPTTTTASSTPPARPVPPVPTTPIVSAPPVAAPIAPPTTAPQSPSVVELKTVETTPPIIPAQAPAHQPVPATHTVQTPFGPATMPPAHYNPRSAPTDMPPALPAGYGPQATVSTPAPQPVSTVAASSNSHTSVRTTLPRPVGAAVARRMSQSGRNPRPLPQTPGLPASALSQTITPATTPVVASPSEPQIGNEIPDDDLMTPMAARQPQPVVNPGDQTVAEIIRDLSQSKRAPVIDTYDQELERKLAATKKDIKALDAITQQATDELGKAKKATEQPPTTQSTSPTPAQRKAMKEAKKLSQSTNQTEAAQPQPAQSTDKSAPTPPPVPQELLRGLAKQAPQAAAQGADDLFNPDGTPKKTLKKVAAGKRKTPGLYGLGDAFQTALDKKGFINPQATATLAESRAEDWGNLPDSLIKTAVAHAGETKDKASHVVPPVRPATTTPASHTKTTKVSSIPAEQDPAPKPTQQELLSAATRDDDEKAKREAVRKAMSESAFVGTADEWASAVLSTGALPKTPAQ